MAASFLSVDCCAPTKGGLQVGPLDDGFFPQGDSSGVESGTSSSSGSCSCESPCSYKLLDIPVGPFTAMDFFDGQVLCYDEKYNRIVCVDLRRVERRYCGVPKSLHFSKYYWSHIVVINKGVLLVLLKNHASHVFHLVSLSFKQGELATVVLDQVRTKISADGYEVCCQQLGGRVYFGFLNRRRSDRARTSRAFRETRSDLELLCAQFNATGTQTSSEDSGLEVDHMPTVVHSENCEATFNLEADVFVGESVLLQVACSSSGYIEQKVHAVGKLLSAAFSRVGSNLCKTGLTSAATKMRLASLGIPFIYNGEAYFIDRTDPKQVFVVRTHFECGLMAAIQHRLQAMSKRADKGIVRKLNALCTPPALSSLNAVWSGIALEGSRAYLFIQNRTTWRCALWGLELSGTKGRAGLLLTSAKDQNVNRSDRLTQTAEKHISIVRLDSDGHVEEYMDSSFVKNCQVSYRSATAIDKMDEAAVVVGRSVCWLNVVDDLEIPNFRLRENSSLRFDKAYNHFCVKGSSVCDKERTSRHCILTVSLGDVS